MAKKRTCCIGWTKDMQRTKANLLASAGPVEAGPLIRMVVTAPHRLRVLAIHGRNAARRVRQNKERSEHFNRRFAAAAG